MLCTVFIHSLFRIIKLTRSQSLAGSFYDTLQLVNKNRTRALSMKLSQPSHFKVDELQTICMPWVSMPAQLLTWLLFSWFVCLLVFVPVFLPSYVFFILSFLFKPTPGLPFLTYDVETPLFSQVGQGTWRWIACISRIPLPAFQTPSGCKRVIQTYVTAHTAWLVYRVRWKYILKTLPCASLPCLFPRLFFI